MNSLPISLRQRYENFNLSKKLTLSFLIAAVIPLLLVFVLAYYNSANAIKEQVYNQLSAISSIKQSALERYFKQVEFKLITTALNPTTQNAASDFIESYEQVSTANYSRAEVEQYYQNTFFSEFKKSNNSAKNLEINLTRLDSKAIALQTRFITQNTHPIGSKQLLKQSAANDDYDKTHNLYHDYFTKLIEYYEFYDLFIVDNNSGDIVYSVYKELDFATSLLSGPYKDSNLATVFKKARTLSKAQSVAFSDYQTYYPSYNAPASFIATPINSEATLIFQLSIDALNTIMSERDGLGESGETYLVGPDKLMRSDSYLDPVHHSVINSFKFPEKGAVDTFSIQQALQGNSGQKIIDDYNGNPVLSSYHPLNILDTNWALIAEIDESEAFAAVDRLALLLTLVLIIVIAVIAFVAPKFANFLSSPIKHLSELMKSVEKTGDFSKRTANINRDEIGETALAFNNLLASLQTSITETNEVMQQLSEGNFNARITIECKGELDSLKRATNDSAEALNSAMRELNAVVNAMSQGHFDKQISLAMSGDLNTLKDNINSTLSNLDLAVNDIVCVMKSMAQGDFKQQVNIKCHGKLDELKQGINQSVISINNALSTIDTAMAELSDGNLEAQINVPLNGQLNELKQKINRTILNISTVINEISFVMANVSEGNFNSQVESEMSGQFSRLKDDVNMSIKSVNHAVNDISEVMNGISQGNYKKQITSEMKGQLHHLKCNINESVESIKEVITSLSFVAEAMSNGDFSKFIELDFKGDLAQLKNDINEAVSSTSAAIEEVSQSLSALSKGDLTKQMRGNYNGIFNQLQHNINQTTKQLIEVISNIQSSAEEVKQCAKEISVSNTEISERTEEQAASLEQASASTKTMLEEVFGVVQQSKNAVEQSNCATQTAQQGKELSIQTQRSIEDVEQSSKSINEIVEVIDGLAFQTNLLALNAAVEAARAGENGRGFAVVANEVRELASRSAKSAKQIRDIITDSNDKVHLGSQFAISSGDKLNHIVNRVEEVNQSIELISESSSNQSNSLKEVDVVVQRLATIVQQNSAITEETMAAANLMAERAANMNSLLAYFKTEDVHTPEPLAGELILESKYA
ncbi:methyl-accepting chemotaxis protein [Pseudoalteromonas sp. G4]|uniref:methyl-accepting chemotaxis protein n=1 Tax=Pseudoalteromonas sp. G4 TaxID=2992761 RepID=UPI00237E1C3E|nr:methyl-accepting chemotaxis protein [Pseudoalteromonas sp. G4]MDE3271059.1 methyl-accepting chemotaxis protein [Pseudoalteromonas sp. G4]